MEIEQLGPYRVIRELGHGGMGTVYEGLDLETGQRVAVKLLATLLVEREGFRERFKAEIETLKRLHHPNIVRLFGFGQQHHHLFYAMELVDGQSLERELERGRRFDWHEVTQIGIEVCRALRHAHDRGVIHRDIKPGNLLMARNGQVKLSDFGIARLFGNSSLTGVGKVLGTAEYMAPEQAEGRPVTPRSDLYSLGAVFYVLLTRRPLFRGQSLPEVLHKQRFEKPDPVGDHAPDVPEALGQIIAQLLEKHPDRRVANADVLARQLESMQRALSLEVNWDSTTAEAQADAVAPEDDAAGAPPATVTGTWAAGQLPATLPDRDAVAEPPPVQPPGPAATDLPETKVTTAFKAADQPETTDQEKPEGHFTPVAEEDLDRAETREERPALISLQTWVLAAGLIIVGLVVWYLLQPQSKDALYQEIAARAAEDTVASLLQAEHEIEDFLSLYPDDPRCAQLQVYATEIELERLERRLELKAKGLSGTQDLLPIERAYLEAINYVWLDPEKGMAKLQAIIDLYDHQADPSAPTGKCLELARRRLAQLSEQLDRQAAQQLALVQDRLEHARQLAQNDPQRARSMYRAVIELYQDKPWAAEEVRHDQEALDTTQPQPGPGNQLSPR